MERYKKGAVPAAWHHGYQAGEFAVARLCPYSTGSVLAKGSARRGYQKAREEQQQGSPASSKLRGTNDHT